MHSFASPIAILAILAIAALLGSLYVMFICTKNLIRFIREEFRK